MRLCDGQRVWVRCEVRPGPFANERMVRIKDAIAAQWDEDEWVGFVSEELLEENIQEGGTRVQALVAGDFYSAPPILRIPNAGLNGDLFQVKLYEVQRVEGGV